jgi:hypothetical protein
VEKTLPPAGKLCNPCLRASRRPHGRGKTVTVAKGWGLVTKQEESMEITKRRLADIVPYAANAKKHDKRQINNVAESIKQYGFVQPIVIDRDGVIIIGHCRALAARKLTARKEGAYGKAKKGNRSEAVREPLRPAMHA